MESPILYDFGSTGKQKQWQIKVTGNTNGTAVIETIFGQTGGTLQKRLKNITEGKNLGKSNETTPLEQAIAEATSTLNKKKKEGYSERQIGTPGGSTVPKASSLGTTKTVDTNTVETEKPPLPMLALEYQKRGHDIKFPCCAQPKIDGVRAVLFKGKLWSRNGNEFTGMEHILNHLTNVSIILDGELYANPDEIPFQKLVGLVKKSTYSKQELEDIKKIKYLVYDCISNQDFVDRHTTVASVIKDLSGPVELLETWTCTNKDEIEPLLTKCLNAGWEGLIVRSTKGPYQTKVRSKNLQKLKVFATDEFDIVDFTQGTGSDEGTIIFVCKTPEGNTFSVRPVGTKEERADMFKNGKSYIGKQLTVKYQNLMEGSNIPRFPVGLTVRDYE